MLCIGLSAAYAVVRTCLRLSVWLSVHVRVGPYSAEKSKHIFKLFHHLVDHHPSFHIPNFTTIFRRGSPLTIASMQVRRQKIAILDEYLSIRSMTGSVQSCEHATVDCAVYCTDRHASVNLFITASSMDDHGRSEAVEACARCILYY